MRRSTPQPDGPGARRRGLSRPKPPRVIISGDDALDPADWDVVVVENDTISSERALEIANERRRQKLAELPSLDAREIAEALGLDADGPGEGNDDINEDAFALPGDTPAVRRVNDAPLLGITFDGVDEPGGEPTGQHKIVSRFPTETGHMLSIVHEPEPAAPTVPAADDISFAEPDEVLAAAATAPEPAPVAPTAPPSAPVADTSTRFPVDNVDDGFYDIGDEAIDAPVVIDPTADVGDEPVEAIEGDGLERDDDVAIDDDPHNTFYAIDDKDPAETLADPVPAFVDNGPTQEVKLWGSARAAAADGNIYAPGEAPPDPIDEAVEDDVYSSFPIDPDEFLTEEGAEVDVNELDYASVFGPVDAPDVLAPVPVAAKVPDLDPVEVAAHAPITESPARRRRRKAAAAGATTVSGVLAKAKRAKADEGDQFEDLRGPDGQDTFEDLRNIEADADEWGWRDEFVDEPTQAVAYGADRGTEAHDESGYVFTFDDTIDPLHDGPLLVDQRPRHIREDATPRRGRRELVALGAAALIVVAVAASSKIFNSADRPSFDTGEAATETTTPRQTIPPSSTTSFTIDPNIVPTVPTIGTDITTPTTATSGGKKTTTTTVKKGATTTTTAPATTTTTAPATTTTTEPPPTTTTTEVPVP